MKNYCVDLEIAKELKDNGFPQNSYFWWNKTRCSITAPTSDEILKELPKEIKTKRDCYRIDIGYDIVKKVWYCGICEFFEDKKLSNALAKMWLYLKKEGYIK